MANEKYYSIITHSDMDGIVSAMLLREIFNVDKVIFKEPASIQSGRFVPRRNEIVCDLPKSGALWFDHHRQDISKSEDAPISYYDPEAPSAARIIFETYKNKLKQWEGLVKETDIIDTASYTKEDFLNPTPPQIISITLRTCDKERDDNYRLYVLNSLSYLTVEQIANSSMVQKRYKEKLKKWEEGIKLISPYIKKKCAVCTIDLTSLKEPPEWRIHQIYFKDLNMDFVISARRLSITGDVKITVGTNIFTKKIHDIDLGDMMREFGGGGHKGIGGVTLKYDKYKEIIEEIEKRLIGDTNKN